VASARVARSGEKSAHGRGESVRRLAGAEGAGLKYLRKRNKPESSGSLSNILWLMFESVPVEDELLDTAASPP
jgi:hypothetical protein